MRMCEFETTSRKGYRVTELFAWARYKRGDIPAQAEFDYIDKRVKAKFPDAELVGMRRTFVPASPSDPTEVWWEFKWIVFNDIKEKCIHKKTIELVAKAREAIGGTK